MDDPLDFVLVVLLNFLLSESQLVWVKVLREVVVVVAYRTKEPKTMRMVDSTDDALGTTFQRLHDLTQAIFDSFLHLPTDCRLNDCPIVLVNHE